MAKVCKPFLCNLIVPLLVGMSLLFSVFYIISATLIAFERTKYASLSAEAASLVRADANMLEQSSSSLTALWKSSEFVSQDEFETFTEYSSKHKLGVTSQRWFQSDDNGLGIIYETGTDNDRWSDLPPETKDHIIKSIEESHRGNDVVFSDPFRLSDGSLAVTVISSSRLGENDGATGYAAITNKLSSLTNLARLSLGQDAHSAVITTDGVAVTLDNLTYCATEPDNQNSPPKTDPCPKEVMEIVRSSFSATVGLAGSDWRIFIKPTAKQNSWMLTTFHLLGFLAVLLISYLWASLKHQKNVLQNLAEREKTFVSLVSHQLREPLTQLSWGCDSLLDDERLSVEHKDKVRALLKMLRRASKMVNDLLNVSRLERGVLSLDLEEVPMATIIDDVLFTLKTEVKERESSILTDISPDHQVYADRVKTGEAIRNIIDNAIKYGTKGGLIEIKSETKSKMTVLTVTDHGPGIPQELRATIFDKETAFRRQKDHKGTGLGLFLSKMFIEAQGGSLSFESSHLGTIFRIQIPTSMKVE